MSKLFQSALVGIAGGGSVEGGTVGGPDKTYVVAIGEKSIVAEPVKDEVAQQIAAEHAGPAAVVKAESPEGAIKTAFSPPHQERR